MSLYIGHLFVALNIIIVLLIHESAFADGASRPNFKARSIVNKYRSKDDRKVTRILLSAKNTADALQEHQFSKQICQVALPALAASIVEPALTMIDMYFVGTQKDEVSATGGLAGLSVTGSLFNIIAAVTYPLCSGTTAVISRALGEASKDAKFDAASGPTCASSFEVRKGGKTSLLGSILLNGLLLGSVSGSLIALLLGRYTNQLLAKAFALETSVLAITEKYIKIRGISLPFSLMQYVLIGFCLAVQDVKTPLVSIAASSLTNIVGDYILVYRLHMGLVGAAIATALATSVSCFVSLYRLLLRYVEYNQKQSILANLRTWVNALDIPRMKQFFETSSALLAGLLANQLTYSAGAKISACVSDTSISLAGQSITGGSVTHIAGHQIAMQIWWFLSYFSAPLSFSGQAILPKDLRQGNIRQVNRGISSLLRMATFVAFACTTLNVLFLTVTPNLFTTNPAVQTAFKSVLPQVMLSQLFVSLCTAMDGVYIGTDRIPDYVTLSVLSTVAAWMYYLFIAIKHKQGITGTWNGLVIFGSTRLAYHALNLIRGRMWLADPAVAV